MIHEIIGWLASAFFAICLAPQAWKTHKEGPKGLSLGFVLFTFLGNLGMLDFLISQEVSQPQLYLNPSVALLLSAYLLYKIIYPNRISIFNEEILTAEEFDCSKTYHLGDIVKYKGEFLCLYPDGFHNEDGKRFDLNFMNSKDYETPKETIDHHEFAKRVREEWNLNPEDMRQSCWDRWYHYTAIINGKKKIVGEYGIRRSVSAFILYKKDGSEEVFGCR